MSTIVGVETDRGVALAADRANVTDGTVGGSVDRVFEFEAAGAAAVGEPGDVASFGRRLGSELDRDRLERDRPVSVERLARVASRLAEEEGVEAVLAARDESGTARLRSVDSAGAVLADAVAAFGSGAAMALGILEGSAADDEPDDPAEQVGSVLATVAERDSGTGDEIDTYALENDP